MVKKKSAPLPQENPAPKKKYNYTRVPGQPTKYRPEFCEMLVEHMSEGLSFEAFAGVISVDRDTLFEWKNKHKDFSDAFKEGNGRRRLWDEKVLNDHVTGKSKGSPAAIMYKMKAFHRLTDDVIGLRKLKMLQLDTMSPEQIRELAVKLLKD